MSVLLIDDTYSLMAMSDPLAHLTGDTVLSATDLCSALKLIEAQKPTTVISGLPLTDDLGMTLLLWVSARHPGLPVVVLLKDLTDDLAQRAQWFGAMGTLAKSLDPRVLPCGLAPMLGIASPVVEPRPPAVSAIRHLTLVPPLKAPVDTDGALSGLFRGLGEVRGLRGSLALDGDGSLLSCKSSDETLEARGIAATLHGLIEARHDTFSPVGAGQCQVATIRSDSETYVVSCCNDSGRHLHFVTVLTDGGNRPLVEMAHKRLHRQLLEAVGSAVA